MIDYTKIYLLNVDYSKVLQSNYLDFKSEVSLTTGEINENCKIAEYLHCKVVMKTNKDGKVHITFKGSIHKLWNELNNIKAPNYNPSKPYSGYNGNDFTINDIIEVRKHLELVLCCNASQMLFQNIEFGVNICVDFELKLFLKGLLYHRNKLFEFSHNGNNAQAEHYNFYFKIYNKSFQYGMNENVLRVELKFTKMVEVKDLNFKTFAEINQNVLDNAKDLLLKKFDEVVYYDYTIDKRKLSKFQLKEIKNYSNPRYWIEDLKPQHRHRHKDRLQQIIINHSNNLHQQIKNKIIEKCVIINRPIKSQKCVIINTSSIGLEITQTNTKKGVIKLDKAQLQKPNICKLTGLDISPQKKSILLSHTGLKYYFENDKRTFEQVKNKYLSKKWIQSDHQTQIKELAHNIRTTINNQKVKQHKIYHPAQLNILVSLGFNNNLNL
jgi:hypothetical protein